MSFFKRDWRYRAFLAHGIVEEVESVLVVARRQQEARRQELFRVLDLEERWEGLSQRGWEVGSRHTHGRQSMAS